MTTLLVEPPARECRLTDQAGDTLPVGEAPLFLIHNRHHGGIHRGIHTVAAGNGAGGQ